MPSCFRRRPRLLGVWLEHLNLAIRPASYQPSVSCPAHTLDEVLVRLGLPFLLSAGKVPDFYDTVTAATGKMFEGIRVLCEGVYTVDVAGLETAKEGLREHALDFCRIESSGVLSRAFERMVVGVQIPRDFCDIGARRLRRGRGSAEGLDLHAGYRARGRPALPVSPSRTFGGPSRFLEARVGPANQRRR